MDAVSHVLRMAQLDARLDRRCLLGRATRMDVAGSSTRGEAPFHVLIEGECRLHVGSTSLDLTSGDIVVIPSGAPHRITTSGSGRQRGTTETAGDGFVTTHSESGGAAEIDLFCGRYTFEPGVGEMLLRSLPDLVHVSFGRSTPDAKTVRMLAALMRGEAQREGDGTAAILSAMCTVLLAMVLRTSQSDTTTSKLWTAATDDRIAGAVRAVLSDPGDNWSVDRLARLVGMARATLQRRFLQDTGMTVGAFVGRARLMAAAELLGSTDATVATVSRQVGYRSESAFSRAFRDESGFTPARFRRHHQQQERGAAG